MYLPRHVMSCITSFVGFARNLTTLVDLHHILAENAVDDWAHDGQGIKEYFYIGPGWYREEHPLDGEKMLNDFLDFMLFIREFDSPFLRKCILHTSLKRKLNVRLTERERYMHRLHGILKEDCIANPDKDAMVLVEEFYTPRKPPRPEPDFPGSNIRPYITNRD